MKFIFQILLVMLFTKYPLDGAIVCKVLPLFARKINMILVHYMWRDFQSIKFHCVCSLYQLVDWVGQTKNVFYPQAASQTIHGTTSIVLCR